MERNEGLVVSTTVVFSETREVADAAGDCKDGDDEDGNPKESWDQAEDAAPTMELRRH